MVSSSATTAASEPKTRWFPAFEAKLPSLKGKTIAITGCTSGIGLVAAKTCVRKGATNVILLNRSSDRATKAEAQIKAVAATTAGTDSKVVTIPCDLQDFTSVRRAITTIKAEYDTLDVLCNNAGIALQPDKATKDGYDVQMQVNHLSHFLLVKDLFPLLQKAAEIRGEARIVQQSSVSRYTAGTLSLCGGSGLERKYFEKNGGNLGGDSPGWMGAKSQRYSQSKLANSVFTMALKNKLVGTNIKAVVATPGMSSTGMLDHALDATNTGFFMRQLNSIGASMAQSNQDGAMPLLAACFDPSTESGDFWDPSKMGGMKGPPRKVRADKKTRSTANADLLWSKSEEAVGMFRL